jgi:hypothetical protein
MAGERETNRMADVRVAGLTTGRLEEAAGLPVRCFHRSRRR